MLYRHINTNKLSVLGSIIMLLFFAISCGSNLADANVGKHASTTYAVQGGVWCDHDKDGEGGSFPDHGVSYAIVAYKLSDDGENWDPTWCLTYADVYGNYSFDKDDSQYALVKTFPVSGHFDYWYPQYEEVQWDYENTPWVVPAYYGAIYPLQFCGSNHLH
jgi:hypothetical protein